MAATAATVPTPLQSCTDRRGKKFVQGARVVSRRTKLYIYDDLGRGRVYAENEMVYMKKVFSYLQSVYLRQQCKLIKNEKFCATSWNYQDSEDAFSCGKVKEAFEQALKLGEVNVAYGRVMFIGEAGAGKSTLLGALMNHPLADEATSTPMADTKEVKYQWKRSFKPGDGYWCDLTEEDELEELAVLAKQVNSEKKLEDLTAAFAVKIFSPGEKKCSGLSHISNASFENDAEKGHSEIVAKARSYLVGNASLDAGIDQYLNVWDCGGQRVFLDVLPAFLTSRTMFFLMFDASKDMHDKVSVVWNQNGKSTKLETLNLSTLDLMVQWMSCINASLSKRAERYYRAQHSSSGASVPSFPRIVVIGTHGDMLDADRKEAITGECEREYKGKPFSDQVKGILILNCKKRGNEEDPGIKEVKRAVSEFISDALCIPTPIAWVLFRKLFTKLTKSKPIVSLDDVAIIAKACEIDDDTTLLSVLGFYHELGVFLHYSDVNSMKDIVIAQPKWLVEQFGTLLASDISVGSLVGPREARRLLHKNGILVEALYNEVWKTSIPDRVVDPQAFVDLLDHFLLIAEIKEAVPSVPISYGKKYFMPCMLPLCPIDTIETPPDAVLVSAPLHLTFSSKYVPPGFFVRLATLLTKTHGFCIAFKPGVYSNRITFKYGEDERNCSIDDVTLYGSNFSIHVDIVRRSHCFYVDRYNFPSTCRSILKLLLGAIHDLYLWFPSIEVRPGFKCESCKGAIPHFAPISTETESITSLRCEFDAVSQPTAEQQLWLKIPAATCKEGVLYQSEIKALLKEMDGEDFAKLSKALEMKQSDIRCIDDQVLVVCNWSSKMGGLARSHLAYHLERINMSILAQRVRIGQYKHAEDSDNENEVPVHVYSEVTNEELTRCSAYVADNADLSILAVHLGVPVEHTPTALLTMLKKWQQQNKPQAYKQTLIDILTGSGGAFDKAARALSGDGIEVPDLQALYTSVGKECIADWYKLGLQLGIPDQALRAIQSDCYNKCEDAMMRMLSKWLEVCTTPTWRAVITSLREIDKNSLAKTIERRYC